MAAERCTGMAAADTVAVGTATATAVAVAVAVAVVGKGRTVVGTGSS